jgi:hypothetical protein
MKTPETTLSDRVSASECGALHRFVRRRCRRPRWVNRHQQAVIEYLQEENRVLLEQLAGKPKRFTDAQRIRLARKARSVGRRRLGQLVTIVTPDALLRTISLFSIP